ncbi:hypothetical protein IFM89_033753 [Coptis chinensis]|uniref:Uncharacterized protein n=1 Tax=Coptis chinensis TaxID=261450 RepID=A0A835HTN3_9MAGN|nr:hypothetical protein IFM89_033753 [Coptis chinensis]
MVGRVGGAFGFPTTSPNGDIKMMFPIMYPAFVPGLIPMQNQEQQTNLGAGLYDVPTFPFMPPMSGIPSNTLIPLNYIVPTRRTTTEDGAMTDEHGQEGRQQHAPQRQVVTRALTPLIRWLSQGMHRAATPPQPQPPVRAENALGAARPDGENAARAEGQPRDENQGENENRLVEHDNQVEPN